MATATLSQPKAKNKNGIIIGSVIILFLLAGLVYWLMTKDKKPVSETLNKVLPPPTSGSPNPTNTPPKTNTTPPISTHIMPTGGNIGKNVLSKYGGTYVYRISDDTIYRTLYADEVGFKVVNETVDKVDNGVNYIWKNVDIYFK